MRENWVILLIVFNYCLLTGCKKNDVGPGVPQPGNYVLASDFIYDSPVLYTANGKIIDYEFIQAFLMRNIWPAYPPPPRPRDSLVSSFFPLPGTKYPTAPSSISMEILANGQFNFKSSNLSNAPNKPGRIIGNMGEYSIIETDAHYNFYDEAQIADCINLREGVFAASVLDSIKYSGPSIFSYYTRRYPMRFRNGTPELFFTSVHYGHRYCNRITTKVFNAPHPDLIKKLGPQDTIVMQISRLSFIKQ